MKAPIFALLALTISSTSHAFVRMIDDCSTPDGKYRITLRQGADNAPHTGSASVEDENGKVLGGYSVVNPMIHSASFGSASDWQAADNNGADFHLNGPSTNSRTTSFSAVLDDGQTVSGRDLQCTVWNGTVVQQ
jgi:hypothetical protein